MTQPKKTGGGGRPQKTPRPKKPPRYTGKALIIYRVYLALVILSAVVVVGYILFNLFSAPPDPVVNRPEVVRPPMTTTTVDPETGEEIEIEIPGLPANRKKEFYTFLVVGQSQDAGGKLSDTMMLVAYDVPNQKLNVLNLPRDTYVRYRGDAVLLNSIFNRGGGVEGLKKEVQELTGIYPDYHVIIQWEALGELVDAIGGVYFDVPFNMYYNDLSQHFKIDVKKGYQLLNGKDAMGVVRWRQNSIGDTGKKDDHYGYAEGDLGRIKTQQAFMKAVIAKCLQPDVLLPNLAEYISIFQNNVETDLTVSNMTYFGKSAIGGLDMENVSFATVPNKDAGNGHLIPLGSQLVSIINEGFNPYEENIRLGELDLVTSVALPSAKPTESEEPDVTDDPEESDDPDVTDSPEPTESGDDVVLPPGTIVRPSSSPNVSGSPKPSGSPRPSEEPSASPRPSQSAAPSPTPSNPGGIVLPGEEEPPAATPAPTPPPAEDPVLPPGV